MPPRKPIVPPTLADDAPVHKEFLAAIHEGDVAKAKKLIKENKVYPFCSAFFAFNFKYCFFYQRF